MRTTRTRTIRIGRNGRRGSAFVWLIVALACASTGRAQSLSSEAIGAGFDAPMVVTHAPGFPDLLFVAEREGIIRAVDLETRTRTGNAVSIPYAREAARAMRSSRAADGVTLPLR